MVVSRHSPSSSSLPQDIQAQLKKRALLNPSILYRQVPCVSAKFWAIFDSNKHSFVHGRREYIRRECASLTKIMTAYTIISLAKRYNLEIETKAIEVCGVAASVRGTSALLRKGDVFTIEQLLYALMLPSGNDAAFALAKFFGKLLFERKGYTEVDMDRIRSF